MRCLAWALISMCVVGCAWPAGLPETAAPGRAPDGTPYPDLRATAGPREPARGDAAVIVAIEDYVGMSDRFGAQAMAAAWYRHFREDLGVRPWRIKLLRDAEAEPARIAAALAEARWWVRDDSVLWFVFIGHVSGEPGRYGELWLRAGDGTEATRDRATVAISDLLPLLDRGHHPRSVAVFDGCMPPGLLPAGSETPALALAPMPGSMHMGTDPTATETRTPQSVMGEARSRALQDLERSRNTPTDLALFSAGFGRGCVDHLPGTRFPALSYLVLGALRGWADADGDHDVTAVEAIHGVQTLVHRAAPGIPARPSLFSADIVLARGVHEAAPPVRAATPADGAAPAAAIPPPVVVHDAMIRFEPGKYRMGCRDAGCERDERPSHRVVLSRFLLDPREVTVGEYQNCVASGRCSAIDSARCYVWTGAEFRRGAALPEALLASDNPAMCVTWDQADGYCRAVGKRLPTEAEWERAAAGTDGRRFPWGDAAPSCARAHHDGCGEHTRPVGTHPAGATPEGVHDLAGNVAEWVHDWYARRAYRMLRRRDPVEQDAGEVRVVRGGSFYDGEANLRAAYRYGLTPVVGYSTVGFRCAR